MTFMVGIASSIFVPSQQGIAVTYGLAQQEAVLPTALFVLGLAFGPLVTRTAGLVTGRLLVYMLCILPFAAFTLATGLVQTSYGVMICRALAGLFAGPILSTGYAVVSDLWIQGEWAVPNMFYCVAPMLGAVVGVVLGGPIAQYQNWRWSQWVILLSIAVCVLSTLLMRETSASAIRRKRQTFGEGWKEADIRSAITSSWREMLTEAPALLLSLYSSLVFAILYASFIAFPAAFTNSYDFGISAQSITLVSMLVGICLALLALLLYNTLIHTPRVVHWEATQEANHEKAETERRRQTNRSSRISTTSVSNFSRAQLRRPTSEKSLRISNDTDASIRTKRASQLTSQERNVALALAAIRYLSGIHENESKMIDPERLVILLNRNPTFGDLCLALEGHTLKLDRPQFAKVLVDALPRLDAEKTDLARGLVRSPSLHRYAATAALESAIGPVNVPEGARPAKAELHAPSEWLLWPVLPASVLLPAGLFIFAWTARAGIHWIVPCLGMGLFALSGTVVVVATQAYMTERYGDTVLHAGLMMRYVLSFAFLMFATPLYSALGVNWATSVFGFASVAMTTPAWFIIIEQIIAKKPADAETVR